MPSTKAATPPGPRGTGFPSSPVTRSLAQTGPSRRCGQPGRRHSYLARCPHRLEGPVCASDRVKGEDGKPVPRGPGGVAAFVDGIKSYHLSKYHRSPR